MNEYGSEKVLKALNWQAKKKVSQDAFFAAVQDTMDSLGLEEDEAIQSVVEEFQIQEVDMSDVVLLSDADKLTSHPTYAVLQQFKVAAASTADEMDAHCAKVTEWLSAKENQQRQQNLAVALQGGFLRDLLEIVAKDGLADSRLAAVLRICTLMMQSESIRDSFPSQVQGVEPATTGPALIARLLSQQPLPSSDAIQAVGDLCTAAARAAEDTKSALMDSSYPDAALIVAGNDTTPLSAAVPLLTSLQAMITHDDDRPPASKAFMHARMLALDRGAVPVFLHVMRRALTSPPELQASIAALQALCANDDVCKQVCDARGVQTLVQAVDDHFGDESIVAAACGLLRHLAKSDTVKKLFVGIGGLQHATIVLEAHKQSPRVCTQVLGLLATVLLRQPEHCDALAGDASLFGHITDAILAQRGSAPVMRQAAQLVRNLIVRNTHLRPQVLAAQGVEPALRAGRRLPDCGDVCCAALRDLGLTDYLTP
eukprot:jgi/Ulvmu1/8141/UM040_0037.1